MIFPAHPLAEKLRQQDIGRNNNEEKQSDHPAVIDRDADGYESDDDVRDEYLDHVGVQRVYALDIFQKLALQFPRFDLFMICDGKMLQFTDDRSAHPGARSSEHSVGDARIDDMRGDILHQYDDEHDGVDDKRPYHAVRPLAARQIDDIRRDNGHDPDGKIFKDEHQEAHAKTAFVFLQEPFIIQKTRPLLFLAGIDRHVFVKKVLEIGDHIIAALILLFGIGALCRVHTLSSLLCAAARRRAPVDPKYKVGGSFPYRRHYSIIPPAKKQLFCRILSPQSATKNLRLTLYICGRSCDIKNCLPSNIIYDTLDASIISDAADNGRAKGEK